jgi:hypothetical protein
MFSKKLAALAALSMITASSAAIAQSAAPLSVSAPAARAGADTQGSSELRGTTAWILAAIALGLIIWGVIQLTDDDGASSP